MRPAQVATSTRHFGVVGLVAILAACGGDSDSPGTPPPPPVASVGISQDTATLVRAATVQLTATPRDASGSPVSQRVAWRSSSDAIARVSSAGVVTGVATGTATITATSGGRSGTSRVSVKDGGVVGAAGATLTAQGGNLTLTIPAGAISQQMMVTLEPSTSAPAEPRTIGSTAFDIGPATGVFIAPATITIRYVDSNIPTGPPEALLRMARVAGTTWHDVPGSLPNGTANTVTASVYEFGTYALRTPPFVASVALSADVATVRLGGLPVTLTATPRDADGRALEGRTVTWSSSNTAIATVGAATGAVTAVAQGEATITANVEGRTATARVTVVVPVASIAIGPASPTVDVWGTSQLTATTRDANGNTLTGRVVTWSSSDPTRASVSGSGLLSGLVSGSTIVTATSEGVSASVTVTVPQQPPVQVTSVSPGSLAPGATFTVTGANFSTVLAATATAVTATSLTGRAAAAFRYTCQATQDVPVTVTVNLASASGTATLALAAQRSLALGETLLLLNATDNLTCNEFPVTGGMYVVGLLNLSTSPGSVSSYEFRGSAGRPAPAGATPAAGAAVSATLAVERTPLDAAAPLTPQSELALAAEAEARAHSRILQQNRAVIERTPR